MSLWASAVGGSFDRRLYFAGWLRGIITRTELPDGAIRSSQRSAAMTKWVLHQIKYLRLLAVPCLGLHRRFDTTGHRGIQSTGLPAKYSNTAKHLPCAQDWPNPKLV